MDQSKKTVHIDELNLDDLATIDLEGDRKHDPNAGPLLRIKPLLKLKTGVRAGGAIVGLGRE